MECSSGNGCFPQCRKRLRLHYDSAAAFVGFKKAGRSSFNIICQASISGVLSKTELGSSLQPAQTLECIAGGGALVETGTKEFAGELHHEQPLVFNNGTAVIILYGFLSNLDELFKWIESDKAAESYSGSYGLCGSLSSRRFQSQSHAAEALLELYSQTGRRDHLIMLSELQVCAILCPVSAVRC